jgi:hypothetical protein
MLDDQQPGTHAYNASAFLQDQLYEARVFLGLSGNLDSPRSRLDAGQIDHAALGLAYDLLPEDHDVTIGQGEAIKPERIKDQAREIVAGADDGESLERG